jgi:hypothetical protein
MVLQIENLSDAARLDRRKFFTSRDDLILTEHQILAQGRVDRYIPSSITSPLSATESCA